MFLYGIPSLLLLLLFGINENCHRWMNQMLKATKPLFTYLKQDTLQNF